MPILNVRKLSFWFWAAARRNKSMDEFGRVWRSGKLVVNEECDMRCIAFNKVRKSWCASSRRGTSYVKRVFNFNEKFFNPGKVAKKTKF